MRAKKITTTMRKALILLILMAFVKGAFASPVKHSGAAMQKIRHRNFAHLQAPSPAFLSNDTMGSLGSPLLDELLVPGDKTEYALPHKFVLGGTTASFENNDALPLEEYLSVTKGASLNLSYPLSPKLSLNGGYVILNGNALGTQQEMQIPVFSALYRFSPRTSISISYKNENPAGNGTLSGNTQHTSAELRIHF